MNRLFGGFSHTFLAFSSYTPQPRFAFSPAQNYYGTAGKDVSTYLTSAMATLQHEWQTWQQLFPTNLDNIKQDLFAVGTYKSVGLDAWDMHDLAWNKNTFGAASTCPQTVTVQGRVYLAEEVNYLLWGAVNALAGRTKAHATLYVKAHRMLGKGAYQYYPGHVIGRVAWAEAGYDMIVSGGSLVAPAYSALHRCTPNATVWHPNHSVIPPTNPYQASEGTVHVGDFSATGLDKIQFRV